MAAAQPAALAVTKALAVEQPMFAQRPHLAIALLWPREAVAPGDSLVVPVVQPVVSPEMREPVVKARVVSQAPQHLVETADHQTAVPGERPVAWVLAEPAEPAQPLEAVEAAADTTAEAVVAQTSMAAAPTVAVAAEAHHGTTPH
jgi:hypothetical protein